MLPTIREGLANFAITHQELSSRAMIKHSTFDRGVREAVSGQGENGVSEEGVSNSVKMHEKEEAVKAVIRQSSETRDEKAVAGRVRKSPDAQSSDG